MSHLWGIAWTLGFPALCGAQSCLTASADYGHCHPRPGVSREEQHPAIWAETSSPWSWCIPYPNIARAAHLPGFLNILGHQLRGWMVIPGLFVSLSCCLSQMGIPHHRAFFKTQMNKWQVFSWMKDRSPGSLTGKYPYLNFWSCSVLYSGFSACKVARDSHLQAFAEVWTGQKKLHIPDIGNTSAKAYRFCHSCREPVKPMVQQKK